MKRRILPLGLRKPVMHTIDQLADNGILTPVGSTWAITIVIQLKKGRRAPRIFGDYRITVNEFPKQTSFFDI